MQCGRRACASRTRFALTSNVWGLLAAGLMLACGVPAVAGPDAVVLNGDAATATGNQSQGVRSGTHFWIPPTYRLNIHSLISDVQPGAGLDGAQMYHVAGNGGDGSGCTTHGFSGGAGGGGASMTLSFAELTHGIITSGDGAYGLEMQSYGGHGGDGGFAFGFPIPPFFVITGPAFGGHAGRGGAGGALTLTSNGDITTGGADAMAIYLRSEAGDGGDGGYAFSTTYAEGGDGGVGGAGGAINVTNSGALTTTGSGAGGIVAQSFGGEGGDGGGGDGSFGSGGAGKGSGPGGDVTVTNSGRITTGGLGAKGILATSVGGFAGGGGHGGGIFSWGGSGASSGHGGAVAVTNDAQVITDGEHADALFAQSVGGGGGSGGGSGGLFTYGGSGQAGGDGGQVSVDVGWGATLAETYQLHTRGDDASGIFAQSLGGGGGDGGGAVATGGNFSLAIGGSAGPGGAGGAVNLVVDPDVTVYTEGDRAPGIHAQSLGGGGGNGGYAVSAAAGSMASFGVAIGGRGSQGGNGGAVTVTNDSAITTRGHMSHGLYVQSTGGGGGSGGFAIAAAASDLWSASFALGGSAGGGGSASAVDVTNSGFVEVGGQEAVGVLVESVGGGGGGGGWSVSGAGAGVGALGLSIGGSGGKGGDGSTVVLVNTGEVTTTGYRGFGIHAHSVGGGGGSGGFSISGAGAGSGALTFNMGGSAGGGGSADKVEVTSAGAITTSGADAIGLLVESTGGGGGNGGFSITGAGAGWGALSVGIGGKGGTGGNGGAVEVDAGSEILTWGTNAHAICASSTGGGGGSGGFSIVGSGAGTFAGTFSLGGSGGGGGSGSAVTVESTGLLDTRGHGSVGLLAESVGGGGGRGGWSLSGSGAGTGSFSIGIGGWGGDGGDGGVVTVDSDSEINTLGAESHGIHAHSTGGGGGIGGFSISGSGAGTFGGTFNLGGHGGDGGGGSDVTVYSDGKITTAGTGAVGIIAETVGGGGGRGGWSLTGAGGGTSALSVGIGGYGGDGGGAGGIVTVDATSDIMTGGASAHAIHAISTGGGGGVGGFSISGSGGGDYSGSFSLGGAGGDGGSGGAVDVTSEGTLDVSGSGAKGIFAESTGGGGGNGGWSITGSGAGTGALSVGIGGIGGKGGAGGDVDVTNLGDITTRGSDGIGIYAESVGGGGGNGGFSITGDGAGKGGKSWGLSIGGSGGNGNSGGAVDVFSDGVITTIGAAAHGIEARSSGGGGGKGGFAASVGIGFGGAKDTWNLNLNTALGGSGGDGNLGGDVTVTSRNDITTAQHDAHGIYAQSLGGGGGSGGSSLTATIGFGAANEGRSLNGSLSIGGGGGKGNLGGAVVVDSINDILTGGDKSDAIRAQSIGGGGGDGGSARGISMLFKVGSADLKKDQTPGSNWKFSVNVGGNGGTGDNSGTVKVTHAGDLVTWGAISRGIVAQSVGGGGGSGGDGIIGTGTEADYATLALVPFQEMGGSGNWLLKKLVGQLRDVSVAVGGDQGGSGDGNAVTIDNTGDITTFGFGSAAIFAQSIGGGGGEAQSFTVGEDKGGRAVSGLLGKFAFGGAAGDGKTVTIDQDGDINTWADEAHGIFAQSIGGGGGLAGNVDRATAQAEGRWRGIGLGLGFGGGGGSAGNGDSVTVTSMGDITTRGIEAIGIKAMSIGGGGGSGGGTGYGPQNIFSRFDGSIGGDGSGGAVTVHHTGNITTTGDMSDGVFAQSAGGTQRGDAVTVTVHGDVRASGVDSCGIIANSRGDQAAGDITINAHGAVVAGSGDAVGIHVLEGANNTVSIHDLLTTANGCAGSAIIATTGNDTVINRGRIVGDVNLGAGANRFENAAGAVFEPGAAIGLGAGNALINSGLVSLGGCDAVRTTTLASDYMQMPGGAMEIDIDPKHGSADCLVVDGAACIEGCVRTNVVNAGQAFAGRKIITIVQATQGLTDGGCRLEQQSSAVMSCQLAHPDANSLALDMNVDFAPKGMCGNQTSIAQYVNAIQNAGGSPGFEPVAAMLMSMPDSKSLAEAYDALSPEPVGQTSQAAPMTNLTFVQAMHSVPVREGEHRFATERSGLWATARTQFTDKEETTELLGSRSRTVMFIVGMQRPLDEQANWIGGLAFAAEHSNTDVGVMSETGGESIRFGGVLKRRFGATRIDLSASVSHGWYSTDRVTNVPFAGATASGDWDLTTVSGNLRLAHDFEFEQDDWYLRPILDLGITYIRREGYTETGAAGASLNIAENDETLYYISPALQLGMEHRLGNGIILRPYIRGGLTYARYDTQPETVAGFVSAPIGVPPMRTLGEQEQTLGTVAVGIDIIEVNGASLKLEYTGQFSSRTESHGGLLKVVIPF